MPMIAKLVYDGGNVHIPEEMIPKEGIQKALDKGQLVGTERERLCEIAGRVCYDSLGSGRSSAEYHKHILEVNHLSTIEHAWITISLESKSIMLDSERFKYRIMRYLIGRPGIIVRIDSQNNLNITFNLRHVLDFDKWSTALSTAFDLSLNEEMLSSLRACLYAAAHELAPQIVPAVNVDNAVCSYTIVTMGQLPIEQYITMFLGGSRGFSHEMVRHRFNISQRSTRYCDESESEWVWHPLIDKLSDEIHKHQLNEAKAACQDAYNVTVENLQKQLINSGVDKFTARKQARGAARGVLGNALYTEMLFTASVQSWKWMIGLRGTLAADAEIRIIFSKVVQELKKSRYADQFSGYTLAPSPDGLGEVVLG